MRTHWQPWTLCTTLLLLCAAGGTAPAKEVICKVELDRDILPADGEHTAVVKVSLDARPVKKSGDRPPINLAIVLDRSGSMSGAKIEKAKDAAVAALRRLGPDDLFSLVIYDHEVETVVPAQSARRTEWIEAQIRGITARGNTALFAGVSQGAAEVRKHLEDRRYIPRIILLSDGLANVGPSSPADLGRLGAGLIKENISVTTVGVGTDYNEDLMTQLSQRSDGNTYFVESSQDLPRIFAAELGDVLSVVARKVTIEIECPDGVRPLRIIGRDGRIEKGKVEIYLNQLYGGQEKYVLLEVAVAPTKSNSSREIAVARCRYESALTQKGETAEGRVTARFSEREEEVVKSANKAVQADVGRNTIAIIKDTVVVLSDEGKTAAAVKALKEKSAELRKMGADYDNAALTKQSAELDEAASSLEANGMDKRLRKVYRSDSYQIRNQQEAQ